MLKIWRKYVKKTLDILGITKQINDNTNILSAIYDSGVGTVKVPKVYVADYGGGLANFTPPADAEDGDLVIAVDTNATTPAQAIYFKANGTWYKVTA